MSKVISKYLFKKRNCRRCRALLLGSGTRSRLGMTNSQRLNSAEDLYCQPLTSQYRALQFVLQGFCLKWVLNHTTSGSISAAGRAGRGLAWLSPGEALRLRDDSDCDPAVTATALTDSSGCQLQPGGGAWPGQNARWRAAGPHWRCSGAGNHHDLPKYFQARSFHRLGTPVSSSKVECQLVP